MATTLGELLVSIKADTDSFNHDIAEVKKTTEETGEAATTTGSKVKAMFTGVAVAAVVAAIKEVGSASLETASELQETQNKFDAVYSSIQGVAEITAGELADSYGLSEIAAKGMLSATGDLLTGMDFTQESALSLSTQVLSLGTDLASFTNYSGGAEGASEALTKALLGERESLKTLGISISEAQVEAEVLRMAQEGLTFNTEAQAKAQATLNLAMSQSKNAIGDFERSIDSYANQTRVATSATEDLKSQLGRSLVPTATTVVSIYGQLTGKLAEYLEKLNDVREAEAAAEAGVATKEQELLLINNKIESVKKELAGVEMLRGKYTYHSRVVQEMYKTQIERLENQLNSLGRAKDAVNAQIKADEDLAEQEALRAEQEAKAEADREAAAAAAQLRAQETMSLIDGIVESTEDEIETLDRQIAAIEALEAQDEETKEKQAEAIRILTEEREAALEERQAMIDEEEEAELAAIEAVKEAELAAIEEARVKKQEAFENDLSNFESYSTAALGIIDSIHSTQLNNIESEAASKIAALDEELMGEEAYAAAVEQIEYDAAMASWEVEKAQLAASKANALIEIAINTAVGVSKAIAQGGVAGIVTGALVSVAGAAQAAAVMSEPDPEMPEFAEGGVATGATTAIVGEDEGEVLIGMGAKGSPLLDDLASRIGNKISGGSTSNTFVVNQNNMLNLSNEQGLSDVAEALYDKLEAVKLRRGVST